MKSANLPHYVPHNSIAVQRAAASVGASVNLVTKSAPIGAPIGAIGGLGLGVGAAARFGCPLCDASVYSYCSHKALQDGCCCNGGRPPVGFGYACPPARCNFLHANSCYEHQLIVQCCCNRP